MPTTQAQRAQAGKIGGLTTASRHDPKVYTAKARRTFLESFAQEADPDGTLTPDERDRRADALKRRRMAELALRSSQVRAQRRAQAVAS